MPKFVTYFFTIVLLLFLREHVLSQNISTDKLNSISKDFEQSYTVNNDTSTAKNYETLAKTFSEIGEYSKAEEYFRKSLAIYIKLNLKDDKARVARSLAKMQEQQGKQQEAVKNYELAKNASTDKEQAITNSNDANRLLNKSNPAVQNTFSNDNRKIFKKQGLQNEIADTYLQQAKNSTNQNDTNGAIANYNNALNYLNEDPVQQLKVKDEISNIYANTNQTEKAKEIKNDIISQAQESKDVNTEIKQKQSLAKIYFKEKNNDEAIKLLQESYDKALESSNTIEAKKSLELLIRHYQDHGDYGKSIQLYGQFFNKLEQLVKSDSSLIDTQLLAATEEKIKQLEKQKELQDELIARKNTFSYVLVGAIILIIIFLLFLIKALFSVKNKNKEIALQSLRREMNPHFIFNSLNSVNQFIAENKELEANKYLSSYSNLMRNIMENSNKDFISLSREIELTKKYLDLEHLRFKEKFDYKLLVDEKLDADATFVPNMIIQPQLENAIWHGLRYENEKGLLQIRFSQQNNDICIEIEDDGIGLTKSKELKTLNQKEHTSRGLNNTMERIKLLNELYGTKIDLTITEKTGEGMQGTLVKIIFPLINKI